MASSLNKIMLIGFTGKDAEIRYTNTGTAVLSFTLATNYPQKNADGNWDTATTWHDIVCYGKLAENLKDYIKKGKRLYVEGRLNKRDYTDKSNIKRYVVEVIADTIILLDRASVQEPESDIAEEPGTDYASSNSTDTISNPEDDLPF